jgi:hypothetical protein
MWHRELCEPMRMMFNRAARIGCKLRSWHDLIPHGKWLEWCRQNIPEIHERSIQNYLRLWDNHEWLVARLNTKPDSDLEELPTIKEALALLADKRKADQPAPIKEKRASRRQQIDVEACPLGSDEDTKTVRPQIINAPPEPAAPSQILISAEQLTTLCPQCRALLKGEF